MKNRHHAFVIEAGGERGVQAARAWVKEELGMELRNNPDIVVLRYGLFSVEDARSVLESAAQAPFFGSSKAVIIAASRAYHEAQNALLKLFEEPPPGTYLFFVLPSLGGLLPTLRSRVQVLNVGRQASHIPEAAAEFIKASKEKRSAMIKRLASGADEEERRENRERALAIVNGIEEAAYLSEDGVPAHAKLLQEIQILREHLYDRSAPVRMILEHLSLVIPRNLL